ncbi:MAG: hypothetical protein HUJ56_08550 [Erysipelotrichaceae bacterium]|nr:hypothetical protein [Erysipelotrichaceae bacterium]
MNKLTLRYIRKPYPIILEDLTSQGLTIEGKSIIYGQSLTVPTNVACELAEEIHPEILQRAVELAKSFYVGELKSIVELGQRSE